MFHLTPKYLNIRHYVQIIQGFHSYENALIIDLSERKLHITLASG